MEDVTDTVFRRLLIRWGRPHLFFTEFTRVDAPVRNRADSQRLRFYPEERPIIAQLWGTRPHEFAAACVELERRGFDGVDINMGCPAKKIRKSGAGAGLIDTPALAAEIIAASRDATTLPISVKTRIGNRRRVTESWCAFLLEQDLAALTVHGRTAEEMSEPPADWDAVRLVVEMRNAIAPQTVILGNGDAQSLEHGRRLVAQTGCDGVMFGRAIFEDPHLFAPRPSAESGAAPHAPRLSLLIEHLRAYEAEWDARRNYEALKKFFRNYVRGFEGAPELLAQLYETHSYADAYAVLHHVGCVTELVEKETGHAGQRLPGDFQQTW